MTLERLDHLVLTVRDIEATCDFYVRVLGMREIVFQRGRKALALGQQKINLHQIGTAIDPKAAAPTPGSADLCFITNEDLSGIVAHLEACGAQIVDGPVERVGAAGPMMSVYLRDPDGNLIEISRYDAARGALLSNVRFAQTLDILRNLMRVGCKPRHLKARRRHPGVTDGAWICPRLAEGFSENHRKREKGMWRIL